jgi:two-component system NtrC family sensor kinase
MIKDDILSIFRARGIPIPGRGEKIKVYLKKLIQPFEGTSLNQGRPGKTPAQNNKFTASQDMAERALLRRPSFSIRLHITLVLLFCFLLALVINGVLLLTVNKIEEKLYFLQVADSYLFEIQQARRFEKNFFLYATNLDDALTHIRTAEKLLLSNADKLKKVTGEELFRKKVNDVKQYEKLLRDLAPGGNAKTEDWHDRGINEDEIRKLGSEIVTSAQDLVYRERKTVASMITWTKRIPIYFLIVLSMLMIYIAFFLMRRIMRPIGRFLGYTKRIAQGDFTPIAPARRYRDEFSNLAIAINRMSKELEERQEQLIQSRKMAAIGTLTSGVAHELNNPINNIVLTAESMKEGFHDISPDEALELLHDILVQSERCSEIVKNLLDFARSERPEFEPIPIASVIEDTLRLVRNQMSLSKVHSKVEIPPDLPLVYEDRKSLQQVFLNLFLNAIQAMPNGGILGTMAFVAEDGQCVKVEISDTGVGIDPKHLPHIFDPFFTTKELGKGTGLGLSVTYGILRRQGGHIDVRSQKGLGTTFTVTFPIHKEGETSN